MKPILYHDRELKLLIIFNPTFTIDIRLLFSLLPISCICNRGLSRDKMSVSTVWVKQKRGTLCIISEIFYADHFEPFTRVRVWNICYIGKENKPHKQNKKKTIQNGNLHTATILSQFKQKLMSLIFLLPVVMLNCSLVQRKPTVRKAWIVSAL